MKRQNAKGETVELFGHCDFKIIVGKREFTHSFKAGPGKRYTIEDCEQMLENVVKYCDDKLPTLEFRMVQLLPNKFNLIAVKVKPRQGATGEQNEREQKVEAAGKAALEDGSLDRTGEEGEQSQRSDLPAEPQAAESGTASGRDREDDRPAWQPGEPADGKGTETDGGDDGAGKTGLPSDPSPV